MSIFKAYDIRGVVPDELDADDAYRIGRAVARHIDAPSLAVGRDARPSSPELFEELVRGVTDEGTDVVDLGLVCTPMLYFAVDHLGSGGGIMLTASHNPARYNGFKVCREHAIPVGEASGIPAAFYFLPADPREKTPMRVNLTHLKSPFNRMKLRHELWKKKYPDAKEVHGIPWTGIENAPPEVQDLAKPSVNIKKLPFDPLEYVEHLDQLPFHPNMDPDVGR